MKLNFFTSQPNDEQDGQCAYYVTLRRVHETTIVVEKQYVLYICLVVCVRAHVLIALHIQCVRHIVSSFMASLAPSHFWTLSLKRHDFR